MKEVSGREAMEALALGMALYNEDGTIADTFVRNRKFMVGEHPHAEVIRAFGNGEEVQFFDGDRWVKTDAPGFYRDYKYRVKLDTKVQEGNTLQLWDNSLWTITTGQKLYEMYGIAENEGENLVAFSQCGNNALGVKWESPKRLLSGRIVKHVFIVPKNQESK